MDSQVSPAEATMILALLAAIVIDTGWDGNRTVHAFTPPIEVAVENDRARVGIVLPLRIKDLDLALVVGSSYSSARAWLVDKPPPPRYYAIAREVDHTRFYSGQEDIYARMHVYGNRTPIDWFTWEYRIHKEPVWQYADKFGRVPTGTVHTEAMMYAGKRIGPIYARLGTNERLNRWDFIIMRKANFA